MRHPFQCRCGTLQGRISHPAKALRGVCYCADCQAYAHASGNANEVLDALGGTTAVATQTCHVGITAGHDQLACDSLTERGLLRWYARCCGTPLANTARNPKFPYVGMLQVCLGSPESVERSFGPIRLRMHAKRARGPVDAMAGRTMLALMGFVPMLFMGWLNGSYRRSSFFLPDGTPRALPRVVPAGTLPASR